jgi:DNA-binding transcriptional MerR regulator
VLRFWESKFPQIRPVKRAGGRRYYRPDDIALLGGIKILLHDQGMTIRGVQKLLRERGPKHVATLSALPWEGTDSEELVSGDLGEVVREAEADASSSFGDQAPESTAATAKVTAEPAPSSRLRVVSSGIHADRLAQLREILAVADAARLRQWAPSLRPLVRRLEALRSRAF